MLSATIEHQTLEKEYSVVSPSKEFTFTLSVSRFKSLISNRVEVKGYFFRSSDKQVLCGLTQKEFGPPYTQGRFPIDLSDCPGKLPRWSKDSRHVKYWFTNKDFVISGVEKTASGYRFLGDAGVQFEPLE